MDKITCGPWEIHEIEGEQTGLVLGNGRTICDTKRAYWVMHALLTEPERAERVAECEANARLISASRDLFDAARAVLALENEITTGTAYREYRALEAAVAKAEGKP